MAEKSSRWWGINIPYHFIQLLLKAISIGDVFYSICVYGFGIMQVSELSYSSLYLHRKERVFLPIGTCNSKLCLRSL